MIPVQLQSATLLPLRLRACALLGSAYFFSLGLERHTARKFEPRIEAHHQEPLTGDTMS